MPSHTFDCNFGSAADAAAAIAAREITSVELTEHTFERIDRFQPQLNAFVYQLREEALQQARRVDAAIAAGENPGRLAGVPVVVKESFAIAGRPCTWGVPALKGSQARENSTVVRRLTDAGAVILGATNVPLNLWDCQTYNDIYGTTNNPWDVTRTPGGSSGGTAAAIAAGLGFLGMGSDIGGSIRSPAHCCGIYGHKPTLDVVGIRGHAPGGISVDPGFTTLLATGGPMARTAGDLQLGLEVVGGPEPPDDIAYVWKLPQARRDRLRDFRVGYVLEDPAMHVSSEIQPALESVVRTLARAGSKLQPGWPAGFSFSEMLRTYLFMLSAFVYIMSPPPEQERQRAEALREPENPMSSGTLCDFASWQRQNFRRLAYRAMWQRYFQDFDAFLMPVLPVAAFPHDHGPQPARVLHTPEGPLPYFPGLLTYAGLAVITGLPATAAPAGRTEAGLPVGIQIVGPFLEDATPIRLASLLSAENGGFTPPPG